MGHPSWPTGPWPGEASLSPSTSSLPSPLLPADLGQPGGRGQRKEGRACLGPPGVTLAPTTAEVGLTSRQIPRQARGGGGGAGPGAASAENRECLCAGGRSSQGPLGSAPGQLPF